MTHRIFEGDARIADVSHVRRIDHQWIPMPDGTRLSARIWLPDDAERRPVPAILEAIPYRKDDGTSVADEGRHPWFAANGYAGVRLDIRGSGDSEGVLLDEYLEQEQDDAVAAIAWLARQPWCSGKVGMIGYSWGGFAALQVAARRPPELGAIVTVDSTDDRYADDVHYMGGCLLAYYLFSWATSMHVYAALPPDPEVVGERWRTMWRERLESAHPMIEPWLTHQLRDEYWRHGSVCEDFDAIAAPVLAVSGWADGYRSAVLRLLEGLSCPRKGLIGPWSHTYPMEPQAPGPAIGFLQECRRWFDHWLKGVDTGVMDEPPLRVWLQDSMPPQPTYPVRPGRWVSEPEWPSPNVMPRELHLSEHRLSTAPEGDRPVLRHVASELHGSEAGDWDPFGEPADMPPDQRAEDGLCLAFTSDPLDQPLDLLGVPVARLAIAVDQPIALLAVRLCDVDPDGRSTLVTRGVFNVTHRFGHDRAEPAEPGERITVEVPMKAIGQRIPAGHRLRLSVSTGYWPWAWPSPRPVTLELETAGSALVLPERRSSSEEPELRPFEPPELAPRPHVEVVRLEGGDHTLARSIASGEHVVVHRYPHERSVLPSGVEVESREPDIFTIRVGEPLSARVRCERLRSIHRPATGWRVRLEIDGEMAADDQHFHVWTGLRAYEGDACIFTRTWSFDIPRAGV
jgi:putative CocE/NonD family hydrolase